MEIDTEKKIHLFSFGPLDGIDDILVEVDKIDEKSSPGPLVLGNSDTTTFLLLGSIDFHMQAKEIGPGYFWSNSKFLKHLQSWKPDRGVNYQESFLRYSGIVQGLSALLSRRTNTYEQNI